MAAWNRRTALAPSQTAVEPVALAQALKNLTEGAEQEDREILYAAASTLTAQAAALVAAEERVEALMAERTNIIATKREQLAVAESEVSTLKARIAELEAAGQRIVPYLDFTVGPESPGYQPTMPSAVDAFKAAFARRLTHQEKNNGR